MEMYYADGYRVQMGLTDLDLLFTRRGEERVVVTIPVVLAKTLARQLVEAIRMYEAQLGKVLPTAEELEQRFQSLQREEHGK
ncbi:hypothetical protein D6833_10815 [Candidatus Parcubacteria bacterium]|nr:MAG: hypothetical protein D6833_10815 [Candidatus Parcubacteria bacterium]